MRWWFRLQLHTQVFIGAVLGIGAGVLLQEHAQYLQPVGDVFLQLLQFLIVPLVVATLLSGILQMTSVKELGAVGARFFVYLCATSILAAGIGVGVALLIRPGRGLDLAKIDAEAVESTDYDLVSQLLGWVPSNFIASLAEMDMLQIIIGTILFGVTMLLVGRDRIPRLYGLVHEATEVMLRLTSVIVQLSPYGVFALLAAMVGTTGTAMLSAAAKFVIADYLALIVITVVVYPSIIVLFVRANPLKFYRNAWPAMLFAMSTASSSATIPVSMRVAEKNLGVERKVFSFTIPFGATANMDGFAAALGVFAILAADAYGLPITVDVILQIVILGLVLSIGAAGVRGAGTVMAIVLLESLGLPLTIIPLLAAVYPFVDIGHTGMNIGGDLVGTTLVGRAGRAFDRSVFNAKSAAFSRSVQPADDTSAGDDPNPSDHDESRADPGS